MNHASSARIAARWVAIALLATVTTQIIYLFVDDITAATGGAPVRAVLWTTEVVAFTLVAVAAFSAAIRTKVVQTALIAIAVGGVLNALQSGIGLSILIPGSEGGEEAAPIVGAMLGFAFMLYYLAKALFGMAAIGCGLCAFSSGLGAARGLGFLTMVAGVAAAVVNIAALPQSFDLMMLAGALGTLATAMVALLLLILPLPAER